MESFCAGRTEAPGLALRQVSGHSVPRTFPNGLGWALHRAVAVPPFLVPGDTG